MATEKEPRTEVLRSKRRCAPKHQPALTAEYLRARLFGVALIALTACASPPKPKPATPTTAPISVDMEIHPNGQTGSSPMLVHLDVYEIKVPVGELSKNAAFWSMVRNRSLRPEAVARLKRNGLQCGLADRNDWPRFRKLLDALPCRVRKLTMNGQEAPGLSLDMSPPIDAEDVFYINSANRLQGRSFQFCSNYLSLGFLPIDGQKAVRISLTPVVQGKRDRVTFTPMNHEYDSPFESSDHLFDVDLHADVPTSAFMVVGPAGGAIQQSSIGGAFFADRSGAELLEQVLLIVPTYLRTDGQKFTLLQMSDRR